MPKVPFLDLTAQYALIEDEVQAALRRVCLSGRFALGPEVEAFEQAFASYCEVEHCVALSSGTAALHVAMRCLDIGAGDEVITVPMTFVATAWAITYAGATPVFVDIDPVSRTMDPRLLESAITPRTKAIVPVHLYGQPAAMHEIRDIADRHGLRVIEDAAQAHGARCDDGDRDGALATGDARLATTVARPATRDGRGRRVGGLSDVGCFSFYPGKNLGAFGEGGALVTDDAAVAARARALRDHGQSVRYCHDTVGYNYRMDAIQGAVLRIKLVHLDEWNAARRRHAEAYTHALSDQADVTLPAQIPGRPSVHHLFVIESDDRDDLAQSLDRAGVATGLHYPTPVHRQPAYAHLRLGPGSFPVTERLANRCLSLPMFPELTSDQIRHVADAVSSATQPVVA